MHMHMRSRPTSLKRVALCSMHMHMRSRLTSLKRVASCSVLTPERRA